MPPVRAYETLLDDLQQVESQTQRVQIATEIFGKSGADLLNLTGDSVRAAREEMYALGLQISRVDAAKIEEANDAIDHAKMATTGFSNQIAIQFSPIVSALTEKFIEAVKEAGGFGQIADQVFDAVIDGSALAADAMHGLHLVFKSIQAAGQTALSLLATGYSELASGIQDIVNKAIGVINAMIEKANMLPGVDIELMSKMDSEFVKTMGSIAESARQTAADTRTEVLKILNEPMPSEGIRKWAEEAQKEATKRAQDVAAGKAHQIGNDFGSGGIAAAAGSRKDESEVEYMTFDPTVDPEVILAQERIAYLRTLKDAQLASDAESEELAYLNRMEMLRARFEEGELVTLESYNRLKEGVEKQHQDNLKAINNAGYAQRAAFDKKNLSDQSKQVFGTLSNITAGVAQHNKGLFELNKAAGISTAIINTYKGVSESLAAYPMPLAAVMAAAHLAAGLAQVSSIKSQSFGSQSAGATRRTSTSILNRQLSIQVALCGT